MDVTYRQLNRKDEPELRKLVDIVHAGLKDEQYFFKYNDQEYNDMWIKDFVIGAFHPMDGLVGFNLLVIDKECCEMDGVMILPKYRGSKIMLEMSMLLIKHALKIGAKEIITKIHPENTDAVHMPPKIGFVPVGGLQEIKGDRQVLERYVLFKLNLDSNEKIKRFFDKH